MSGYRKSASTTVLLLVLEFGPIGAVPEYRNIVKVACRAKHSRYSSLIDSKVNSWVSQPGNGIRKNLPPICFILSVSSANFIAALIPIQ